MRVCVCVLNTSWMDHVTNNWVFENIDILFTIKKRKLEFLGHFLYSTKYELLQLISMQGKILEKRNMGCYRISWLQNLCNCFGLLSTAIIKVRKTMRSTVSDKARWFSCQTENLAVDTLVVKDISHLLFI